MNGYLLLEGGSEFAGKMVEPDLRAMTAAGGREANMCILPTAAAPDHNDEHAGHNGERWFRNVGIKHITVAPVIDKATADDPSYATIIQNSRFIYMLGGFPRYLGETLAGSRCGQAIRLAFEDGALVGGSSAGAMVLCEHFYDPETGDIVPGLNFIPGACVVPHHNTFGRRWVSHLVELLPDDVVIGIDEQTGLLDDLPNGAWSVYGGGMVTLYHKGVPTVFHRGESIPGLLDH